MLWLGRGASAWCKRPRTAGLCRLAADHRNGGAAYLGTAYNPFETITDPGKKNFSVRNLALSKGLSVDRLEDRRTLLTALDSQRRLIDLEHSSEAIDDFTRQALEMVTGPRAQAAFDITRKKINCASNMA